jgi:hypothetical protein
VQLLGQILEGLWKGFWGVVAALEPIVQAVAESVFDTQIAPGGASAFTAFVLFVIGAWAISRFFFSATKSASNQRQKVFHPTDKTPAQVVQEDRAKTLKAIMGFAFVMAVLYFVGMSM